MAASLAAFYQKIPVGHVEAGLRTHHIYSPWPEELNRQMTSRITALNFAPTKLSRQNLLDENISDDSITVTGHRRENFGEGFLHHFRSPPPVLIKPMPQAPKYHWAADNGTPNSSRSSRNYRTNQRRLSSIFLHFLDPHAHPVLSKQTLQ